MKTNETLEREAFETIANLKPILLGDGSALQTALSREWTTKIPSDNRPHLVNVYAQYGSQFGFMCRYTDNYGVGVLARYDGKVNAVFLNNGTVTVRAILT